jgi:hypothetical protein
MKNHLKHSFLFVLLVTCFIANAQKLPATQQTSLRVPANFKIDGKITEWDNQFQAYNKSTDLFYTIANDDENLYLIVQAVKPRIIQKIISVGLTFTVNNTGKKNDNAKDNIAISYPLLDLSPAYRILFNAGAREKSSVAINPQIDKQDTTVYTTKHTDSLITIANKMLAINGKTIKVEGIESLSAEPISVYNEEKIKVAATFDKNGNYTYKLAVPLKYLGLAVNDPQKFSYNIRIDGRLVNPKIGLTIHYTYPYPGSGKVDVDADLNSTTDFWAEYTLAKKP